jgi:hypothetical protein
MNLKHYLLIFQLEAYRVMRFLRWIAKHYIGFKSEKGKEPVWTPKAKQLYWLAIVVFIGISFYLLVRQNLFIAAAIIAIIWCNIYVCLILALAIIKPYEIRSSI